MPAPDQFGDFNATALYCPRCRAAMPVRERLLLVLSGGDLYEYRCEQCHTSLGTRTATGTVPDLRV